MIRASFQQLLTASVWILILLWWHNPLSAQKQQQLLPVDTAAVNTFIAQGKEIVFTNPDSAILYYNQAIEHSRRLHYSTGEASGLVESGFAWFIKNKTRQGTALLNNALAVYTRDHIQDDELETRIYLLLAKSYEDIGRSDSSAYYFYLLSSTIDQRQIHNANLEMSLYSGLAVFWLNFPIMADSQLTSQVHLYIEKAKNAAARITDTSKAKADMAFLEGSYYYSRKEYRKAIDFYTSSLLYRQKQKKGNNITNSLFTWLNISSMWLALEEPEKSLPYITRIKQAAGTLSDHSYFLSSAILQEADAYFLQKKYTLTIRTLDTLLPQLLRSGKRNKEITSALKTLAGSYEAIGQYAQAIRYFKEYNRLHDSLTNSTQVDIIRRLEVRYRIADKDKELAYKETAIAQKENRIHIQTIWIIGITSIAALGLLVTALVYKNNNQKIKGLQHLMEVNHLRDVIRGEEKERARVARALHDGAVSRLSAVKMTIDTLLYRNNIIELKPVITELDYSIQELRQTAHNMMPEILQEHGLIAAVTDFCNTIAHAHQITIAIQANGDLPALQQDFALSVYRIIQELVQNIVKHAQCTYAIVQLSVHENILAITVEDNGKGMDINILENGKPNSMGIRSIKSRIKEMSGIIDISSSDAGTSVYIEFGLNTTNRIS